jgi:hypothetical protein
MVLLGMLIVLGPLLFVFYRYRAKRTAFAHHQALPQYQPPSSHESSLILSEF